MASELPPPPGPAVAQIYALVMEDRETARADRQATLAALKHLVQLGVANAENNAALMKEHQCLIACENRKRKTMMQEEPSASKARSTSPNFQSAPPPNYPKDRTPRPAQRYSGGCFTCGKEGHFSRECPKRNYVQARPNAAKKTQVPTQKKRKNVVKRRRNLVSTKKAQEAHDMIIGTFPDNPIPALVLFGSYIKIRRESKLIISRQTNETI
jgi:hypothetical protein